MNSIFKEVIYSNLEKQSTNFDISSQGLSDSMEGTTSG